MKKEQFKRKQTSILISIPLAIILNGNIHFSFYLFVQIYESVQYAFYTLIFLFSSYATSQISNARYATDFLSILHLFQNYSLDLSIMGAILVFYLINLILIIRICKSKGSNFCEKILKIIAIEHFLFIRIGNLPIFNYSISLLKCTQTNQIIDITTCPGSMQYVYYLCGIIIYIATLIISLYFGITIYDNRILSTSPSAIIFSYNEIFKVLQKVILSLTLLLGPDIIYSTILIWVSFILSLIIFFNRYTKCIYPFLNYSNFFTLANESIIFSVTLFAGIFSLTSPPELISLLIFSLAFVAITLFIFEIISYFIMETISNKKIYLLQNQEQKLHFYRAKCLKIKKMQSKYSEFDISKEISQIIAHTNLCKGNQCNCKQILKSLLTINLNRKDSIYEKEQNLKLFYEILMKSDISSTGKNNDIRILLSFYQVMFLQNYTKAFYEIETAAEFNNSFIVQISILLHKKIIEDQIKLLNNMRKENQLEVEKIAKFEIKYSKLQNLIKEGGLKCLDFWIELKNPHIKVNHIVELSDFISEKYFEITRIMKELQSLYSNHVELLRTYAKFLLCVLNNSFESKEYLYKAQESFKKNQIISGNLNESTKFGVYSDAFSIIVSGNKKELGTILNASRGVFNKLGYYSKEVEGINISMIIPQFIGKNHNEYMMKFFEKGTSSFMDREKITFALNKEGYVVPICILVKTIPSLKYGLRFIGFIRILQNIDEFMKPSPEFLGKKMCLILTTSNGSLQGITKRSLKYLGLTQGLIKNDSRGKLSDSFFIQNLSKDLSNPELKQQLNQNGILTSLDLDQIKKFIDTEKEYIDKDNTSILQKDYGTIKVYAISKESSYQNINMIVYGFILDEGEAEKIKNGKSNYKNCLNLEEGEKLKNSNNQKTIQEPFDYEIMSVTNTASTSSSNSIFQRTFNEFKKAITESSFPNSLVFLNRIVTILIMLLIGVSIVEIVIKLIMISQLGNLAKTIRIAFDRSSEYARTGIFVQSLILIANQDQNDHFDHIQNVYSLIQQLLSDSLKNINIMEEDLYDFAVSNNKSLIDANVSIYTLNQQSNQLINSKISYKSLSLLIISYSKLILQLNQTTLKTDYCYFRVGIVCKESTRPSSLDLNMFFVLENIRKGVKDFLDESETNYLNYGTYQISQYKTYIITIICCCILCVVLCITIIIPIISRIQRNIKTVLSIYSLISFTIAEDTISKLYNYLEEAAQDSEEQIKSRNFIKKGNIEEVQGLIQNMEEKDKDPSTIELKEESKEELEELLDANTSDKDNKSKIYIGHKDEFENINTDQYLIVLFLLGLGGIFCIYFIIFLLLSINDLSNINSSLIDMVPLCGRLKGLEWYIFLLRYDITNGNSDANSLNYLTEYKEGVIKTEKQMSNFLFYHSSIFNDLVSYFNNLNSKDFCDLCCDKDQNCRIINNRFLESGLNRAIGIIITYLINLGSEYLYFIDFNLNNITFAQSLMKTEEIDISVYSLLSLIYFAYTKINNEIVGLINQFLLAIQLREVIKFVIFILAMLAILFFLWRLFMKKLMGDIIKSRGILNLLPSEFLSSNETMKDEIMNIINF